MTLEKENSNYDNVSSQSTKALNTNYRRNQISEDDFDDNTSNNLVSDHQYFDDMNMKLSHPTSLRYGKKRSTSSIELYEEITNRQNMKFINESNVPILVKDKDINSNINMKIRIASNSRFTEKSFNHPPKTAPVVLSTSLAALCLHGLDTPTFNLSNTLLPHLFPKTIKTDNKRDKVEMQTNKKLSSQSNSRTSSSDYPKLSPLMFISDTFGQDKK
jgi:hypothetical protein